VLGIMAVLLVTIIARPQVALKSYDSEKSRDIVLCLDVSGSMTPYIGAALDTLDSIYQQNPSDRYSIVAFASRPVTVLPLTRDKVAINQQINLLREVYVKGNDKNYQFQSLVGFSSDIGSGVEESVRRFDDLQTEKVRNIILVSDLDHFDDNPNRDAYLDKINLIPQNRINMFIMQTPLEYDFASSPQQIVAVSGAQLYKIDEENSEASAKQVASQVFGQALNTTVVVSKNYGDYPYILFVALLTCCGLWTGVVALRWRHA
jgi:hypothetical protein